MGSCPDPTDTVIPEPLKRHAFLPGSQTHLRTAPSSTLTLGHAGPGCLGYGLFFFFFFLPIQVSLWSQMKCFFLRRPSLQGPGSPAPPPTLISRSCSV